LRKRPRSLVARAISSPSVRERGVESCRVAKFAAVRAPSFRPYSQMNRQVKGTVKVLPGR
jgi:hypothetical protein